MRLIFAIVSGLLLLGSACVFFRPFMQSERPIDAAAASPARGDLWLALAADRQQFSDQRRGAFFEMAFLLGGQDTASVPRRIETAAKALDLRDKTLQTFLRSDLRLLLLGNGSLSLIKAAYESANLQNRAILATLLDELDPAIVPKVTGRR